MSDRVTASGQKQFSRLERLFHILWKQKDALEDTVFVKRRPQIQLFDNDSQPHKTVLYEYTELSLQLPISCYEQEKQAFHLENLLPCGTDLILVRHAYQLQDLYDLLETKLAKTPHTIGRVIDSEGKILGTRIIPGVRKKHEKALIISGHPGIGKTFSNSYILVRRLLDGKPTILQITERNIHHHHVLFNDDGVMFIDGENFDQYSDNSAILALADQKPQGILCDMQEHQWLVLATSSPRRSNYKTLLNCSRLPSLRKPDVFGLMHLAPKGSEAIFYTTYLFVAVDYFCCYLCGRRESG
jgi:hypothetical protein